MRIAVMVLAILSMLLSAVGLGLFYGTGGLGDTDPRFGIAILATLSGCAMAIVTLIVSLIAAANRRQFAWLIGMIVLFLVIIGGIFGLGYLLPIVVMQPQSLPVCQTAAPTAPQCQLSGAQQFLLSLPTLFGMAGPLLIGLVALIYAFRMRDARIAVPAIPA